MIFNSFAFVAFFVVVYAAYRLNDRRYRVQNRLLLVASYVFYGYWDWRFLSLIFISTVVDYVCGLGIVRIPGRRKAFLAASVVTNLGILATFKYLGFFADSAVALLDTFGFHADPVTLHVVLPVGISFYTFQTMSYTIDIYRGKLDPCRDFLDFALYVSYFPQLVAGPIERASNLLPQLMGPRSPTSEQMREAVWLIAWGYFKKVFVADNLAPMVDQVFGASAPSGLAVILAVYAFTLQVYCDFSGYSNIARGVSKMMGIDLMLNFDLPLLSRSPQERWSRWHISLSTWLRDYLYIPLGGSRGSNWFVNRNLFLTMLLGGLWHGASWNRVLWGAYEGVLLVVNRAVTRFRKSRDHAPPRAGTPGLPASPGRGESLLWRGVGRANVAAGSVLAVVLNLHLFCAGLLVFRAQSMSQAASMFGAIFTNLGTMAESVISAQSVLYFSIVLIVVELVQYFRNDHLFLLKLPRPVQGFVYGLLAYFVLMHGATSEAFFYFQF